MPAQTTHTIFEQISDIIVTQLQRSEEQVKPEADFTADLGFDSLEDVEFIIAIEETFNIEVSDEDAEQIKTVQQAVEKVEQAIK